MGDDLGKADECACDHDAPDAENANERKSLGCRDAQGDQKLVRQCHYDKICEDIHSGAVANGDYAPLEVDGFSTLT